MNQSFQLIMKLINKVTHLISTVDEISYFMLRLSEARMREGEIFFLWLQGKLMKDYLKIPHKG